MARGRTSTIKRLDEPVQEEVNRLVRAGWTIDEITDQLKQLGAQVSRSAVGRYVKGARESMEMYREGQELAKMWLDKLGTDPQGDVARLVPQMLLAVALKTVSQMTEPGAEGEVAKPVKPQDVMLLAKAVKDISASTKDTFVIDKARAEARAQAQRELLAEQSAKLDAVAKRQGVTDLTREAIRRELGITV